MLSFLSSIVHLYFGCKDSKNLWFMQIIMIFYTSKTHRNRGYSRRHHIFLMQGTGGRHRRRNSPDYARDRKGRGDRSKSDRDGMSSSLSHHPVPLYMRHLRPLLTDITPYAHVNLYSHLPAHRISSAHA